MFAGAKIYLPMDNKTIDRLKGLDAGLRAKVNACCDILRGLGRVCVAFSGGADSSLLLALAGETLGRENVLAVMAVGSTFPQWERRSGKEFAQQLGIELIELETAQLTNPNFTANSADRCYHCKNLILTELKAVAAKRGIPHVVTGSNASDSGDYRPGLRAEEQMGIRRPLLEAGLTKNDIREISHTMNLPGWDRPSMACLATRIPYGEQITAEKLNRIERAEDILRARDFSQCRVRTHGETARIEVPPEAIARIVELREEITDAFKKLGFTYVTIDMEGFRSGSMYETL